MKRRSFNKLISMLPIVEVASVKSTNMKVGSKTLSQGSKVGLITPSGIINEDRITKAKANLERLGLIAHHSSNVLLKNGYMAGPDSIRLTELHSMYADNSIDAIWCIRGGYGATRLLDYLDFDLIKKNKKPLIGYSDITALLNTIHQKTGSPCFHGPVASSTFTDYTLAHVAPIFGLDSDLSISVSSENEQRGEEEEIYKYSTIVCGTAEGKLVGGNLSLLVSLIGTDHAVKTKNKIVFIEDVGEAPYRIDRMLTQLISSGFFRKVKGIVLGVFAGCERKSDTSHSLLYVINERLKPLGKPCMYGFSFGHIDNQCTFPIGTKAVMDTDTRTVTLLHKG